MRRLATVLLAALLALPLAGCVAVGEHVKPAADDGAPDPAPTPDPTPAAPTPDEEEPAPEPSEAPAEAPPTNGTSPDPAAPNATAAPDPVTPAPPAPAAVEVFDFVGAIGAAARYPIAAPGTNVSHAFAVRPGATRIVATLTWNATAGDLDAVLVAPGGCAESRLPPEAGGADCAVARAVLQQSDSRWFQKTGGDPVQPDSPSVLDLSADGVAAVAECAEAACEWTAVAYHNAAVQAAYAYRVEVHYG